MQRAFVRALVPLAVLAVGLFIAVGSDGTAKILGWAVVALAGILAVGLLFLEIGESEDRERARGRS